LPILSISRWRDLDAASCRVKLHALRQSHLRYELTDEEWAAIKPMLPNKPRGVPRVNDRRVLNGIFWVLRSGAPSRDLFDTFGPYTTCYNRFVRWRRGCPRAPDKQRQSTVGFR
jgi:hypothetical protein